MKISLHSVSYAGIFYRGEPLSIEDIIAKLSDLGYDGVELMARRPHADPMDLENRNFAKIKCNKFSGPI